MSDAELAAALRAAYAKSISVLAGEESEIMALVRRAAAALDPQSQPKELASSKDETYSELAKRYIVEDNIVSVNGQVGVRLFAKWLDERSGPETTPRPVDFDFACAAVRHFETYEYPPTWVDWPRALQALRNTIDFVNGRAVKTSPDLIPKGTPPS